MCISLTVDFEWDPRKATANLKKHGVAFADAALVLYDDFALTTPDPGDHEEQRFSTVGVDPLGRTLVAIYTWRDQHPRIISARQLLQPSEGSTRGRDEERIRLFSGAPGASPEAATRQDPNHDSHRRRYPEVVPSTLSVGTTKSRTLSAF
jgi:hypothetical protein